MEPEPPKKPKRKVFRGTYGQQKSKVSVPTELASVASTPVSSKSDLKPMKKAPTLAIQRTGEEDMQAAERRRQSERTRQDETSVTEAEAKIQRSIGELRRKKQVLYEADDKATMSRDLTEIRRIDSVISRRELAALRNKRKIDDSADLPPPAKRTATTIGRVSAESKPDPPPKQFPAEASVIGGYEEAVHDEGEDVFMVSATPIPTPRVAGPESRPQKTCSSCMLCKELKVLRETRDKIVKQLGILEAALEIVGGDGGEEARGNCKLSKKLKELRESRDEVVKKIGILEAARDHFEDVVQEV